MSSIDYSEKIPNNVNLGEDRTLKRALEQWQPNYLAWWSDMGPDESQNFDVYLRTAISVDPQGWAQFGHVKMPDADGPPACTSALVRVDSALTV